MTLVLATLLAATPPTGFTASVERVAVQRTSKEASVEVLPLTGRVVLTGLTIAGKPPRLCPTLEKTKTGVVLVCRSRQLWAELSSDARGSFVDLRRLIGLNWSNPDALIPLRAWSLRQLAIPDVCPGQLPAARGECALAAGDYETARKAFAAALDTPDLSLAHFRLGDLALRAGDVEGALAHYAKVSPVGPVGRLAAVRVCELMGTCLSPAASAKVADADGLSAEPAHELELFTLRRELMTGHDEDALARLQRNLEKDSAFCEGLVAFCQRVVEAGLESDDVEARILALSVFLTDQVRHGPLEAQLNPIAAQTARELGAPGFAAGVLASNTPKIPRAQLPAHLLEIVNLYLAAGDRVRAAVVFEYAQSKLGTSAQGGGWAAARRQLGPRTGTTAAPPPAVDDTASLEALTAQVSLSTDLARAAAVRSRASQHQEPQTQPTETTP
ncbi:MAG: hypothetical protein ACOZQL_06360 [Myxococcota bacterium]